MDVTCLERNTHLNEGMKLVAQPVLPYMSYRRRALGRTSISSPSTPGSKVLQNDEFTKDLFRFLQLLCEGHNNGRLVHCFYGLRVLANLASTRPTGKCVLVWNLSVHFWFPWGVVNGHRPKCLWTRLDRPATNRSNETSDVTKFKCILSAVVCSSFRGKYTVDLILSRLWIQPDHSTSVAAILVVYKNASTALLCHRHHIKPAPY